jgi:NitT/TauT family transport system permease protein/putative hydroxymethylpyrimidine transport system permease protein
MSALLLLTALLGAWQLYATYGPLDPLLLPAPSEVAQSLWDDRSLLWSNLLVTAQEVALGLLAALALALVIALGVHLSATARRAVMPLVVASQAVPFVLLAPLLAAWFGYEILPKLVIVALVCFFPIVVTTLDGLASVDPQLRKLLATFGSSRWASLRLVDAPTALPALLSGAKIAVAVAVIGAIFAEQAGSTSGLGHLLMQSIPNLETPRAYAAAVVMALFSIALFGVLALAERRLAPWAARSRNPGGPPS